MWVSERMATFERDFERARNYTYLAVLATEYDLQAILGLRLDVAMADSVDDLSVVHSVLLDGTKSPRYVCGDRPAPSHYTVSLRDELKKLRPAGAEVVLGKVLEEAQNAYVVGERYFGQGIAFQFVPEGDLAGQHCGERLWGVAAYVDVDDYASKQVPIRLLKHNTFSSQVCPQCGEGEVSDGELYVTSVRPFVGTAADGDAFRQATRTYASADLFAATPNEMTLDDFKANGYRNEEQAQLAGRGLYGTYVLVIPKSTLVDHKLPLERVRDIVVRFDFLSVGKKWVGY
jgi:hypothetical protein